MKTTNNLVESNEEKRAGKLRHCNKRSVEAESGKVRMKKSARVEGEV